MSVDESNLYLLCYGSAPPVACGGGGCPDELCNADMHISMSIVFLSGAVVANRLVRTKWSSLGVKS